MILILAGRATRSSLLSPKTPLGERERGVTVLARPRRARSLSLRMSASQPQAAHSTNADANRLLLDRRILSLGPLQAHDTATPSRY